MLESMWIPEHSMQKTISAKFHNADIFMCKHRFLWLWCWIEFYWKKIACRLSLTILIGFKWISSLRWFCNQFPGTKGFHTVVELSDLCSFLDPDNYFQMFLWFKVYSYPPHVMMRECRIEHDTNLRRWEERTKKHIKNCRKYYKVYDEQRLITETLYGWPYGPMVIKWPKCIKFKFCLILSSFWLPGYVTAHWEDCSGGAERS